MIDRQHYYIKEITSLRKNMEKAKKQAKSFSLTMKAKEGGRYAFTASRTCLVSGVDPIITARLLRFAIISQTICQLLSTIERLV